MDHAVRPTKNERRRQVARRRLEEERRRDRRRRSSIAAVLTLAIVGASVAVVLVTAGGSAPARPTPTTGSAVPVPADPSDVVTDGDVRTRPLAAGDVVPDFTAPGLTGGTVSWTSYAGRPTVLTVWAPWCPHCRSELPVLADVVADFPSVSLVTVTTAVDVNPGPTPLEYLRERDLSLPTAVDDTRGTLAATLGIRAFPTIYFVGSDGAVVRAAEGEVSDPDLRRILSGLS
jgi:thiol-disulfide isomerase/thioredoxin